MRRIRVDLREHAGDLAQLIHQPALRVQATGGVRDQYVNVARARRVECIEDDTGCIGVLALGDDRHVVAHAPGLELFDGGGAEGVAGSEHDGAAFVAVTAGQLADGRRLAYAVDADGEHDVRLVAADVQRLLDGRQQIHQ